MTHALCRASQGISLAGSVVDVEVAVVDEEAQVLCEEAAVLCVDVHDRGRRESRHGMTSSRLFSTTFAETATLGVGSG